jgi:hypothetical protein
MKSAPEKIVVLELVVVRLTMPELDASLEALAERVATLERHDRATSSTPAPVPPATPLRPIGAATSVVDRGPEVAPVRPPATTSDATPTAPPAKSTPTSSSTPAPTSVFPSTRTPSGGVGEPTTAEATLDLDEVRRRFVEGVIPRTSRGAQLVLKSAAVVDFDGSRITLAVASEEIRHNTDQISQGLKGALDHEFRMPLTVGWVVDPALHAPAPTPTRASQRVTATPEAAPDFDETSVDDLDGPIVASVAEHLITEMFPGAEEIS